MAVLRRKELLKIFYHLAKTLTPEELSYLKQDAPGSWGNFTHLEGPDGSFSEWEIHNLINIYAVSFRIQEIVDAKIKQHLKEERTYAEGLPKIYLAKVADILGIDITNRNKWQLINEIMKVIGNGKN